MHRKVADCIFPSSPQLRCLDRFSILDDDLEGDDGLVPFWPILQTILSNSVESSSGIVEVLDTISNCLRGSSGKAEDYGMLKQAIDHAGPIFFSTIWPNIVQIALRMPQIFPTGKLPPLQPGDCLPLTRASARCLVAHQFLCTVPEPSWRNDFFDFSVWYDSSQRHPKAVEMYLTALFTYFETSQVDVIDGADTVEYSLHSLSSRSMPSRDLSARTVLCQAAVVNISSYSTVHQELSLQGCSGAVVVSANKDIGFGQSATQEELYVGNSPEACPAVLVTPTLLPDQVLSIKGARPILRISGQRREISWSVINPPVQGGRMLFMDALEIDECDEGDGLLPDLKLQNLEREVLKAYTAFSSWQSEEAATVWTGLWGCGAFNGDPGVKMCILWIAASMAGRKLRILCDASQSEFSALFQRFIGQLEGATVEELRRQIDGVPGTTLRLETMGFLLKIGVEA